MSYPATFNTIGQPLIMLETVDSTNNYAMGLVQSGEAGHGSAFFALEQTAGKGQRGRSWTSVPGENIMVTVVLRPLSSILHQPYLLSAAIALACYDFFKVFAGDETSIKWPNDLYWRDRKAGGILIENIISAGEKGWQWAIVGMGININQATFGELNGKAVSLKQITGREFDIVVMLKELFTAIEKRYQSLNDSTKLMADFNEALYMRGKSVRLKKGAIAFEAVIDQVNENGRLVTNGSAQTEFQVGEVVWER